MPEENALDLEDLKRLATGLIGWDNLTECWPASNQWDWEVGHRSDEGNTYPVMTIATADYGAAYDAEKMARYHAALRPSAVLALIDDNVHARMRIKELDLLFGRYLLAMRSALIEEEHGKGPAAAMEWIYNSLAGPGELPPEGETDSQAYFDREIVAVDQGMEEVFAFLDARRAAKRVTP